MLNVPEYLGHPLIVNNALFALSASDLLFRWEPEVKWTMTRIHHPLPEVDRDISPTARFGGYPPAYAENGLVVADETTHRFLALITGQTQQQWHQDITHSLGIPAVGEHILYTGFGGPGGVGGIVALDARNGDLQWRYAPKDPEPDPQEYQQILSPKSVEVPVYGPSDRILTDRRNGRKITAIELKGYNTAMVTVPVLQPYSTRPFQHWSNSGLVVTKEYVYGEVNHTVVALNRKGGAVVWKYPIGPMDVITSIVATPEHLVFCISTTRNGVREPVWSVEKTRANRLVAVDLKEGKEVWSQNMLRPGNLALANGLLFFTDGSLHVLGGAEEPGDKNEIAQGAKAPTFGAGFGSSGRLSESSVLSSPR
jgi:outer membrane protein assembly factor BamB